MWSALRRQAQRTVNIIIQDCGPLPSPASISTSACRGARADAKPGDAVSQWLADSGLTYRRANQLGHQVRQQLSPTSGDARHLTSCSPWTPPPPPRASFAHGQAVFRDRSHADQPNAEPECPCAAPHLGLWKDLVKPIGFAGAVSAGTQLLGASLYQQHVCAVCGWRTASLWLAS